MSDPIPQYYEHTDKPACKGPMKNPVQHRPATATKHYRRRERPLKESDRRNRRFY